MPGTSPCSTICTPSKRWTTRSRSGRNPTTSTAGRSGGIGSLDPSQFADTRIDHFTYFDSDYTSRTELAGRIYMTVTGASSRDYDGRHIRLTPLDDSDPPEPTAETITMTLRWLEHDDANHNRYITVDQVPSGYHFDNGEKHHVNIEDHEQNDIGFGIPWQGHSARGGEAGDSEAGLTTSDVKIFARSGERGVRGTDMEEDTIQQRQVGFDNAVLDSSDYLPVKVRDTESSNFLRAAIATKDIADRAATPAKVGTAGSEDGQVLTSTGDGAAAAWETLPVTTGSHYQQDDNVDATWAGPPTSRLTIQVEGTVLPPEGSTVIFFLPETGDFTTNEIELQINASGQTGTALDLLDTQGGSISSSELVADDGKVVQYVRGAYHLIEPLVEDFALRGHTDQVPTTRLGTGSVTLPKINTTGSTDNQCLRSTGNDTTPAWEACITDGQIEEEDLATTGVYQANHRPVVAVQDGPFFLASTGLQTTGYGNTSVTGPKIADGALVHRHFTNQSITALRLNSGSADDGHVLTADGSGFAAWEAQTGGGGSTDLSTTQAAGEANVTINSSTGDNAPILPASTTVPGIMSAADKTRLNAVENFALTTQASARVPFTRLPAQMYRSFAVSVASDDNQVVYANGTCDGGSGRLVALNVPGMNNDVGQTFAFQWRDATLTPVGNAICVAVNPTGADDANYVSVRMIRNGALSNLTLGDIVRYSFLILQRVDGRWMYVGGTLPSSKAGVPSGGDDGQVLAKSADGDYALEWIDASGAANNRLIPAGGTTNQALIKTDGVDYNVEWGARGTVVGANPSGTTGTTLTRLVAGRHELQHQRQRRVDGSQRNVHGERGDGHFLDGRQRDADGGEHKRGGRDDRGRQDGREQRLRGIGMGWHQPKHRLRPGRRHHRIAPDSAVHVLRLDDQPGRNFNVPRGRHRANQQQDLYVRADRQRAGQQDDLGHSRRRRVRSACGVDHGRKFGRSGAHLDGRRVGSGVGGRSGLYRVGRDPVHQLRVHRVLEQRRSDSHADRDFDGDQRSDRVPMGGQPRIGRQRRDAQRQCRRCLGR